MSSADLLRQAAAAIAGVADAKSCALRAHDAELASGAPDAHRLDLAGRLVRQLGELTGTLAVCSVGVDPAPRRQLCLWDRP